MQFCLQTRVGIHSHFHLLHQIFSKVKKEICQSVSQLFFQSVSQFFFQSVSLILSNSVSQSLSPFSQSVIVTFQSVSQSFFCQSVSQPFFYCFSQSVSQPFILLVSQVFSHSFSQSVFLSVSQSVLQEASSPNLLNTVALHIIIKKSPQYVASNKTSSPNAV